MGWFGGWFGSSSSDPYSKLDPKLRELLEKESPVKYSTQQQRSAATPAPPPPSQPDAVAAQPAVESDAPKVPAQSLYQDGRYAHLWKTYRDQGAIEAETKTASEKVEDMLEAYKERNYHIGRAALENCALEQEEWVRCLREGDWSDRLQMCRHQVRKFERCYTMQARFLKVLGYGSTFDSTPRIQEDIQSRADQLFHRMLAQEKAIKEAKEAGLPAPVFPPAAVALPVPSPVTPSPQAETDDLAPSEEVLQAWRKKLAGLPEEERTIEEQALRADWRAQKKVATDLRTFWDREAEERKSRQDKGTATLLDTITSALGFTGPGRGPEPKDGKS